MKTKSKPGLRRFQLELMAYGNFYYIERVANLEAALARRPRQLQIDMIGDGEIPADAALLIRSILNQRSPRTRVITNARSSLRGGAVLVWLLGDTRMIRDDAKLFFRRADTSEISEVGLNEPWKDAESDFKDSLSDMDPDEGDYARVLELINEFLPVKEMAGRLIGAPVLRQFGLVENEKVDSFLTTVFSKSPEPAKRPLKAVAAQRVQRPEKAPVRRSR